MFHCVLFRVRQGSFDRGRLHAAHASGRLPDPNSQDQVQVLLQERQSFDASPVTSRYYTSVRVPMVPRWHHRAMMHHSGERGEDVVLQTALYYIETGEKMPRCTSPYNAL